MKSLHLYWSSPTIAWDNLPPAWHSLKIALCYRRPRRPWVDVTAQVNYLSMFYKASVLQGRLKVAFRYFYLCWTAMRWKPLLPNIAPAKSLRSFYRWFRSFIGCFTDVLLVYLLFSFVHGFSLPGPSAVAILIYAFVCRVPRRGKIIFYNSPR